MRLTHKPSITLWRNPHTRRWHWHWKAANGALIGRESQKDGYADVRDAIKGLETVTGGTLTIVYRARSVTDGRLYSQGELYRIRVAEVLPSGTVTREEERIFVAVHW